MKRNVLIFGLILGSLLVANLFYTVNLCYNHPEFQRNDVLGYTIMVVVFSLIFVGIRNYRNKELGGTISFGKAFKAGALMAFVGATLYVVVWILYYYLFVPDFLDKYITHCMLDATRSGATAAELADKTKEMESFREMYKSPLFVVATTYMEVLPIGLVVALISALILKRKPAPVI